MMKSDDHFKTAIKSYVSPRLLDLQIWNCGRSNSNQKGVRLRSISLV